jgi:hypothetical protein
VGGSFASVRVEPQASPEARIALLEGLLEDLLEAIPKQTNDADWWPDELTKAVSEAKSVLNIEQEGL